MADYNIQMKQYNAIDYDNLYPATLSSLVRYPPVSGMISTNVEGALGELYQYVSGVKGFKITTGQYSGTGTHGASHPTSLTFDKSVKFLFVVNNTHGFGTMSREAVSIISWAGQLTDSSKLSSDYTPARTYLITNNGKTISWYSNEVVTQMNISGDVYKYFAVLENVEYIPDVGAKFIYTEDTTFIVPATGLYSIELHGGGGSGGIGHYDNVDYTATSGSAGGGSGEIYNNVSLTKNDSYQITIGQGGIIYSGSSLPSGTNGVQGGTTSFGTYSVAGGYGGLGVVDKTRQPGGNASGSLATNGQNGDYWGNITRGGSGGSTIGDFGNGGAGVNAGMVGVNGKNGAVIITYLGG